jgi:hypothetical protein
MMNSTLLSDEQYDEAVEARKDSVESKDKLSQFDVYRYLSENLCSKIFLTSALVGFLVCSVLGYASTNVNWFKNFHRFYPGISPNTNFYPTVSQMRAIVREKIKPGQILVIVGGNSVFNGVGQPREKIWTDRLQSMLGNHYCVCNFAHRGAFPFDGGYVAAESLCKEYPKMIYVANSAPSFAGTPSADVTYGYLYGQARYRGLLLNDAEREKTIATYLKTLKTEDVEKSAELDLRNRLDSVFYFSDLWNAVAMKAFSTTWRGGPDPFGPRRRTQDIEPEPPPILTRFKDLEVETKHVRGTSAHLFSMDAAGEWQPIESAWQPLDREVSHVIPVAMREHVLVVLVPNCPFYVDKLTADEQKRDRQLYDYAPKRWQSAGIPCVSSSDLVADDYFDRPHLNAVGGKKIAVLVARQIKEMSNKIERFK